MLGVADPHILCGCTNGQNSQRNATTTIIRTMGISLKHPVAINASPLYKPSSSRRAPTMRSKFLGRCETLRESQTHRRGSQRYGGCWSVNAQKKKLSSRQKIDTQILGSKIINENNL